MPARRSLGEGECGASSEEAMTYLTQLEQATQ